ncbi:hypothetical protein D918_06429 [Trichuris suis]|nr:hypothetical protein D918_06429 [Trichuris suis]
MTKAYIIFITKGTAFKKDFAYKLCKRTECKKVVAEYKKECKVKEKLSTALNQELSLKCRLLREKIWVFCLMPCIQRYFDEPKQTKLKMKLAEENRTKKQKKLTSKLTNIKKTIRLKS